MLLVATDCETGHTCRVLTEEMRPGRVLGRWAHELISVPGWDQAGARTRRSDPRTCVQRVMQESPEPPWWMLSTHVKALLACLAWLIVQWLLADLAQSIVRWLCFVRHRPRGSPPVESPAGLLMSSGRAPRGPSPVQMTQALVICGGAVARA